MALNIILLCERHRTVCRAGYVLLAVLCIYEPNYRPALHTWYTGTLVADGLLLCEGHLQLGSAGQICRETCQTKGKRRQARESV